MLKRIVLFIIVMGCVSSAYAAGNCSPFLGLATLNEFFKDKTNQANDVDDYVELKLLDTSIPAVVYSEWSVRVCEDDEVSSNNDNDGCSITTNLTDFTDLQFPWLVLKNATIGDFYNFMTGFDAILLDANNDVIDYLSVDGYTLQENLGCTGASLPYDYQSAVPGASDKFIFRSPDGTGDWDSAESASEDPTEGASNDGDIGAPNLSFSDLIINQGTTSVNVTLTLDVISADTITVNFFTIDDSLLSGVDYTSVNTSGVIAAGNTSLSFTVPVSATSNLGSFKFFISIDSASTGRAVIINHLGSITVIAPAIDHFSINVGTGSANTCTPFNFTVTAKDSSNNVITGYSDTVVISSSTSTGNFSRVIASNSVMPDPDNDDNGSAAYTFNVLDSGEVTLDLTNDHAQVLTISVTDPTIPLTSTSANVTFSDNAFTIIDTDVDITGEDVPVARRDHSYQIQMIRKDPDSGSCGVASGYEGVKALKIWRTKNVLDPSANIPSLAGNNLPSDEPVAANGNITFSAGTADVTLTTNDIGKFSIELEDISNTFVDVTIAGSSNEQTVRPFGLAITGIQGVNPNTGATLPGGDIFATAGENFSAEVYAVLWESNDDLDNDGNVDDGRLFSDNLKAPGFTWEISLDALSTGFQPATGVVGDLLRANISTVTISQAEFENTSNPSFGSVELNDLQYAEVGSFTLRGDSVSFLGTAGVDVTSDDIIIGRFIPASFVLSSVNDGGFQDSCGAFTYIGQDFNFLAAPSFVVTAKNALPVPGNTTNYTGNWSKLTTGSFSLSTVTVDDTNSLDVVHTPASPRVSPLVDNGNGSFAVTFGSDTFCYGLDAGSGCVKQDNSMLSEFSSDINITLSSVIDSDKVSSAVNQLFNPVSNMMRFGRLRVKNVYGSELIDLTMPKQTEYFDGANFVLNTSDNCTLINDSDLTVTSSLSGGSSTVTVISPTAVNGVLNIGLTSPGAGNTGDIDVTPDLNISNNLWLQFNWDGIAGNEDPKGKATFGIYNGNSRQIYFRQIYQ